MDSDRNRDVWNKQKPRRNAIRSQRIYIYIQADSTTFVRQLRHFKIE